MCVLVRKVCVSAIKVCVSVGQVLFSRKVLLCYSMCFYKKGVHKKIQEQFLGFQVKHDVVMKNIFSHGL